MAKSHPQIAASQASRRFKSEFLIHMDGLLGARASATADLVGEKLVASPAQA